MYHPTRGGTRGGQAEFSWQDVRNDKDRENYLGHSVNAPTGRWQKGRDVNWYNKDKNDGDDLERRREELREIKRKEEEEMRRRLGGAPLPPSLSTQAPILGSNLLAGSTSRSSLNPTTTTGSNRSQLDPSKARNWGRTSTGRDDSNSKSASPSLRDHAAVDDDDDDDDGTPPGVTEEEKRIARKLAKMEGKRLRHEERERIREERRNRRGERHHRDDRYEKRRREEDRYRSRSRDSLGPHRYARSRSRERGEYSRSPERARPRSRREDSPRRRNYSEDRRSDGHGHKEEDRSRHGLPESPGYSRNRDGNERRR